MKICPEIQNFVTIGEKKLETLHEDLSIFQLNVQVKQLPVIKPCISPRMNCYVRHM
jgi:hypothetical protein